MGMLKAPRCLLALALLVPAAATAADGARHGSFEANWNLAGGKRIVEVDGELVSTYRLTGKVTVERTDVEGEGSELSREFDSYCIGVSDEKTGGIARCEWVDEDDDSMVLDFVGKIVGPMGTSREASGAIIGGTGKYEGVLGVIETEWLFWESALEEGKIEGRDTKTTGRWTRP